MKIFLIFFLATTFVSAQGISPVIPFQGVLTKSDGTVELTAPSSITFILEYRDNGSQAWFHNATLGDYSFNRGMISYNIGQFNPSQMTSVDFSRPLRIKLTYGTPTTNISIDIQPSAYAMYAVKAGSVSGMKTTDLADVSATPASDKQILRWNQTLGKYLPANEQTGNTSYTSQTPINITANNVIGMQNGTVGQIQSM
jgi:hypothetical protein